MTIQEYQQIMEEYQAGVQEVQKNRRAFDGVLGLGNHPGNAACHEVMDKAVQGLCIRAGEENTPQEQAELVRMIFEAEEKWTGPEYARMMLIATQRHTMVLIPKLTAADREGLRAWYEKKYPRRKRLPVQDEIYKALLG